jgi:polyisoprenoid-binding protein YceI
MTAFYRTALIAGAILALAALPVSSNGGYTFDKEHTSITFSWNHMGLSRQSARVIDYTGSLVLDPADPEAAQVEVVMKAASVATGAPSLDRHFRTADFFNVAQHPTITFRSTAIKRTGDKTADMMGELTLLGVTKPVTLSVTLNGMGEHPFAKFNANYGDKAVAGFSATGTVQRSAFGLTRILPLVPDDIQITIEAEFLTKK